MTRDHATADRVLPARLRELMDAAEASVLTGDEHVPAAVRAQIAATVIATACGDEQAAAARVSGSEHAGADGDEAEPQQPDWAPAALAHAEALASDPSTVGREQIEALSAAGMTPRQIVTVSQVIGWAAFVARVDLLLDALANPAAETGSAAEQPAGTADGSPAPGDDLPHPRKHFAMRGWTGWLPLAGRDEDFPTKDNQKPNDYYRVLVHDPVTLEHRTALYDELLRGEGEATFGDREIVALAVSLTTPCSFCASVHGRRHFLVSKDALSSVELALRGVDAVTDPQQRALARLGIALGAARVEGLEERVAVLRGLGVSDQVIAGAGAVGAMFGWANRLMTTLGEPVD